ncbi:MAG: metal-binding (seleno)protein [Deferrisomatales bacterium]|nr:metal-binding (seleno)protein [Deferrisomatales bacterium]
MTRPIPFRVAGLVLLLAGLLAASTGTWRHRVSHAAEARTVELAVKGMTCASCTFAVKAALKKLDGVKDAKVSYREKKAVVTYDPDRVTPEDLVSAVDKTGFTASLPASTDK